MKFLIRGDLPCREILRGFDGGMLRCLTLFCGLALLAVSAQAEWTTSNFRELAKLPNGALAWQREMISTAGTRVRVSAVSFRTGEATFRVIDNPGGEPVSLAQGLEKIGAFAGVNGSYFHENFTPLGLAISDGSILHAYEKAKLLSGLILVRNNGRIEMIRATRFTKPEGIKQALQAGPWLVEAGVAIPGLNNIKPARRTVVVNDGGEHWAILAIDAVTLADAAELLAVKDLCGSWSIREALNLDGGSSTALLALSNGRAVINIPSFGAVRNYLAIVPASL